MTKVYVVTTGCYSDHEVHSVFSTEEAAKKFVAMASDRDCTGYDEFELDQWVGKKPNGVNYYMVAMDRNGNVVSHMTGGRLPEDDDEDTVYSGALGRFYCWARDLQHAIKIANERRINKIVSGEWAE